MPFIIRKPEDIFEFQKLLVGLEKFLTHNDLLFNPDLYNAVIRSFDRVTAAKIKYFQSKNL